MTFEEYQVWNRTFARYPTDGLNGVLYCTLGLAGEAGEVGNKIKKAIRDDGGVLTPDRRAAVIDELGDCLWYLTALADALDVTLEQVARGNQVKLESRRDRGVLLGDGDNR